MKSGCRSCALAAASSSALGINHRKITHTSTSRWAMPVRSSAPIALRYSASIRAWAHTKLIRQIVLTVTGTELNCSSAASFVGRSQPAPGAIVPQSRGGSRWPRTIRIRQDASVTTVEPAIAVAREEACRTPPGQDRIDALKRASLLRSAAATYGWLFSTKLTAPE